MAGQLNCSGAEWQQAPIPQSGVLISCPNASGTQTECAFILLTHVCYLEEKLSKMLSLEPERPPERCRDGEEEDEGGEVEVQVQVHVQVQVQAQTQEAMFLLIQRWLLG